MTIKRRLQVIERTLSEYTPPSCQVIFHSDERFDGSTSPINCHKDRTVEGCLGCQMVPDKAKCVIKAIKTLEGEPMIPKGIEVGREWVYRSKFPKCELFIFRDQEGGVTSAGCTRNGQDTDEEQDHEPDCSGCPIIYRERVELIKLNPGRWEDRP